MFKKRTLSILLLCSSLTYSQSKLDLDIYYGKNILKEYIRPIADGFSAGLNNGWYNTAKPHKFGGFDITIAGNIVLIPESYKMFSISEIGGKGVFSKQIEALGNEKDTLFLLTTSGKSKNIIEAGNKAKEIGLNVISMSGNNIQELKEFSTMIISIPSNVPGIVQQAHITIGQLICMNIEDSLI
mgnify:CR=1 FL=1